MDKIKILQLGSSSGLYGAERWILALIKKLDPEKIDTWVGAISDCSTEKVALCVEADYCGYETVVFDCSGHRSWLAVKQLKKFIEQESISILHTHGYKTDILGLFATCGTNCKIITTPHGWTDKPDIKLRFYEFMDRFIFPFFDAVVPLSQELYDSLRYIPNLTKKRHLISNGVDIEEVETTMKVSDALSAWHKKGLFVIGYIGRLTSGKGLDTLLSSFSQAAKANWRLAIVGEGEQCEELKMIAKKLNISDKVEFFGYRQDRLAFLKGFNVFVLPSRSEGIPRCLMEAMAARIPVVASDIKGCKNLVKHKKTGLLFQVNKSTDLIKAIEEIELNPTLSKEMSVTAFNYIDSHFSAKTMAQKYTELYLQVL